MNKFVESLRNNSNIVWITISILILVSLFFLGRKAGISKALKEKSVVPLPDGGKTIGDWDTGKNKAGKSANEIALALATKVKKVTKGVYIPNSNPNLDERLLVYISLSTLGNDQLTSIYNQYNINYGKGLLWGFETMTQAIDNEYMAYGGDVQTKLVNRLKSLKLK